jgi:predicted acylesterase/phospholipase RssA
LELLLEVALRGDGHTLESLGVSIFRCIFKLKFIELENNGIYPSVVSGSSIGSLVGGAYACGELDKLERIVKVLTKNSPLNIDFPQSLSWKDYRQFFSDFSHLGDLNLSGLSAGEKMLNTY